MMDHKTQLKPDLPEIHSASRGQKPQAVPWAMPPDLGRSLTDRDRLPLNRKDETHGYDRFRNQARGRPLRSRAQDPLGTRRDQHIAGHRQDLAQPATLSRYLARDRDQRGL